MRIDLKSILSIWSDWKISFLCWLWQVQIIFDLFMSVGNYCESIQAIWTKLKGFFFSFFLSSSFQIDRDHKLICCYSNAARAPPFFMFRCSYTMPLNKTVEFVIVERLTKIGFICPRNRTHTQYSSECVSRMKWKS